MKHFYINLGEKEKKQETTTSSLSNFLKSLSKKGDNEEKGWFNFNFKKAYYSFECTYKYTNGCLSLFIFFYNFSVGLTICRSLYTSCLWLLDNN